eukprot:CAMPEP_0169210734 /NCGR_PEP_ID=MMETSP1016-20121227/15374_1 /TAXON_ID=342587 /ORGANISM="Karlodinium micrum, Strain CCMP2283" /LENGTH=517 /DNA_ID=CAMNT_0009288297 /DNA_START=365 /DNA_END=1918 /DNA_ORIENTATION=-
MDPIGRKRNPSLLDGGALEVAREHLLKTNRNPDLLRDGDKLRESEMTSKIERTSSFGRETRRSMRVGSWPEPGKFHRFVAEDDPTFREYFWNKATSSYACKTPQAYQGTRQNGAYDRSYRVQFTLPDKDGEPKTIEILQSQEKDSPSFGAVRVKLPIDALVSSGKSRLFFKGVKDQSNADLSRIKDGDIIRGMSVPEKDAVKDDRPWWAKIARPALETEQGMVMFDGKSVAAYNAALEENERAGGREAEVVLLIERPFNMKLDDDKFFGLPIRNNPNVPIPILIPRDDNSDGGIPGLPAPPQGPMPPQGPFSSGRMPARDFETYSRSPRVRMQAVSENLRLSGDDLHVRIADTIDDVKRDAQRILHADPNWDNFADDVRFVDPAGTRMNLQCIRSVLGLLHKFCRKFASQEKISITSRTLAGSIPGLEIKANVILGVKGLPIPLLKRSEFMLRATVVGILGFNEQGKINDIAINEMSFNGRRLELPKLDYARLDLNNLSARDYKALLMWTGKAVVGF